MPLRKAGKGRDDNRKELSLPAALRSFKAALAEWAEALTISWDEPGDRDAGEWWIDLAAGRFHTSISWRASAGFGVYTGEDAYGARPDELYQTPELAGRRAAQLYQHWLVDEVIAPLWLADVRDLTGTPQVELAETLERNQPAISRLETRLDVKLSTIARYIEAMGGSLELRVHFKDWQAAIAMPEDLTAKARR